MRRLIAILVVAGGAICVAPAGASAEVYYPWCVAYDGGPEGINATSCAFVSRAQCMATARGMAAMCVENPAPPPVPPRPAKRHRRHTER